MAKTPEYLKELVRNLPNKPGVYQYFDDEGKILYVGKAKSLKNRVSSYFTKNRFENNKTRILVRKIRDIKYIITDSAYDALLLENTLIKKHQPRYNIQLRDDKTYPWICIKKERFPRVFSTRNVIRDGSEYFGPYASVKTMHAILDFVRKLHKLRTCKFNLSEENIEAGKFRVCLEYHIQNCLGPCVGKQKEEEYNQSIDQIRRILKGNISEVIKELKIKMKEHAELLEFEQAQVHKERIDLLENYQMKSTVVSTSINDVDVFTLISDDQFGYVNFMKISNGAIIQSHTLELKKRMNEADSDILLTGISELRERFNSQSKLIYTSLPLEFSIPDAQIHQPQRGDKKKLIDLSLRNVRYFMRDRHLQQDKLDPDRRKNRILGQLQSDLKMESLPEHIECFDNSNIQGAFPVAACVVFKDAKPSKKDYRHFNIKTVVGPDDFASMREVVYRRYKRLIDEEQPLPQLIIIDGGKGQLSAAVESLQKLEIFGLVTIIGIAKRLEEIYFPGDQYPLYIDKRSESLKLIQQLRNEAHRFGITHHRNKRSKGSIKSSLSDIPGIGPKTQEKLLRKFKSIKRIKEAPEEELKALLTAPAYKALQEFLKSQSN
ncbi:excinuclease ABC subunit UvrC [bacterium SCSIO 12741]|nr:excinuclease ABC subunit UvrC [bacterium SCSIO 12741]